MLRESLSVTNSVNPTGDTQVMAAVRDTDRPSRVLVDNDHGERTAEETAALNDRRWRILADRLAELTAANEALANRAERRDRWELAMADMGARQSNALTVLLARDVDLRSEELCGKVVLVVEDDPHLLPVMRSIMAEAGATVYYERSATDARLRVERVGAEDLSCIVIDVRLPDGDGPALAGDLRRRAPKCGVVLTSGYPMDDFEGLADQKRYALLDKPFEPRALTDAVLAAVQLAAAP